MPQFLSSFKSPIQENLSGKISNFFKAAWDIPAASQPQRVGPPHPCSQALKMAVFHFVLRFEVKIFPEEQISPLVSCSFMSSHWPWAHQPDLPAFGGFLVCGASRVRTWTVLGKPDWLVTLLGWLLGCINPPASWSTGHGFCWMIPLQKRPQEPTHYHTELPPRAFSLWRASQVLLAPGKSHRG